MQINKFSSSNVFFFFFFFSGGVCCSTCVSAEGAPCKVSISEAQEIVKKCPELSDGPIIENEGINVSNFVFLY